jgi:hypothetical protein
MGAPGVLLTAMQHAAERVYASRRLAVVWYQGGGPETPLDTICRLCGLSESVSLGGPGAGAPRALGRQQERVAAVDKALAASGQHVLLVIDDVQTLFRAEQPAGDVVLWELCYLGL